MSRIRSIHPGLFTDEAFMTATPFARLLIFGIWCEAWDDGVFEWKPLTLKARVFPVDAVDVRALLEELEGLNFIQRFNAGGKEYGAVRNFRKFQRPKKPNSSRLLPNSMIEYVGIGETSSEEVPHQFPTSGEKSPQREDGGGRMEEGKEDEAAAAASCAAAAGKLPLEEIARRCEEATGWPKLGAVKVIETLISKGYDFEDRILPLMREHAASRKRMGQGPPESWAYFTPMVQDVTRQPPASGKPVEMSFVALDSPAWIALKAKKSESFLRSMLKTVDHVEGVWFPTASLDLAPAVTQ